MVINMNVTFEDVKNNRDIKAYISKADESLLALGYTEHSFAHVHKVSELAGRILQLLGYDDHQVELAKIAGYLRPCPERSRHGFQAPGQDEHES